jgi:hypothetical protein
MSRTGGRIALGCVTAISLPFIVMGAFTIREGLSKVGHDEGAWIAVGAGALFVAVGILFIAGVSYGTRRMAHELTMHEQNPDKPWLWRDDWALGYARETGGTAGVVAIWAFAIVWNAICLPLLLVFRRELERGNTKVLLAAIFPAVGAILLLTAIYLTFRQRRYGRTVCHFEGMPLALGHALRGDIEFQADVQPEKGYVVRLACVNAVTTGTSRNRTTTETIAWDDERTVSASAAMRSPVGTRVPFDFVTPPDAPTTDMRDVNRRTFWRLSVYAEVPGVDLDTSFYLPVFAVAGAPQENSEFVTYAEAHRAIAAQRELDGRSDITATEMPDGGEEFVIRSHPTFGGFVGVVFFLSIWNGAIYLMFHFEAPIFFVVVFGLADLLIFYGFLDYLFGRSTIRAGRDALRFRRSIFGGGSMTSVAAAEVESVSGRADNQNRNYSIELKQRNGGKSDLARFLRTRSDADTVAARIEKALGK